MRKYLRAFEEEKRMKRRAYGKYPDNHRNRTNDSSTYLVDDRFFTPDEFDFRSGFVGKTENRVDSLRVLNDDPNVVSPVIKGRNVVGFENVYRYLLAKGGIDRPVSMFSARWYVFDLPIDSDKYYNHSMYYWTGDGISITDGEFIVMEPEGSMTVVHELTSGGWVSHRVKIGRLSSVAGNAGDYLEDVSTPDRNLYRHDGSGWVPLSYTVVDDVPDTSGFGIGDHVYVRRGVKGFNRPLLWTFNDTSRRWRHNTVLVGPEPANPMEGMLWEDATNTSRRIKRRVNGAWVDVTWVDGVPSGRPSDGTVIYDTRDGWNPSNGWSESNWWRHRDELSPVDLDSLGSEHLAVRPILEFSSSLEFTGVKTRRNQEIDFVLYRWDIGSGAFVADSNGSILRYADGDEWDDYIGKELKFNKTGEILFDINASVSSGYPFWRDLVTNTWHTYWEKSDAVLAPDRDSKGRMLVPPSYSANPKHDAPDTISRSLVAPHLFGILSSQEGFEGSPVGRNNWRYTIRNPFVGSTMIDMETNLYRLSILLSMGDIDIEDVFLYMAKQADRFMARFESSLDRIMSDSSLVAAMNSGTVTIDDVLDIVITEMNKYLRKTVFNGMGTYEKKYWKNGSLVSSGIIEDIPAPLSPSRIGLARAWVPEKWTDWSGKIWLRGHDGSERESYGDQRDDIWLALHERFFNSIPSEYITENTNYSVRNSKSLFHDVDYVNGVSFEIDHEVDGNGIVLNLVDATIEWWSGGNKVKTRQLREGEYVRDTSTGDVWFYNGMEQPFRVVDPNDPSFVSDYTKTEQRDLERRFFTQWMKDGDYHLDHDGRTGDFDINYWTRGTPGHWYGILIDWYGTDRPDTHPWEIAGYSIKPDWWDVTYPSDVIRSDGLPGWSDTHNMWTDLRNGIVDPVSGRQIRMGLPSGVPIPVNSNGDMKPPYDLFGSPTHDITRGWKYGDGSPVERKFRQTPGYQYIRAFTMFLLKPVEVVDRAWTEVSVDIGYGYVWGDPHSVVRSTLMRNAAEDVLFDGEDDSQKGLNSWLIQWMISRGDDVHEGFIPRFRSTEIRHGWFTRSFVKHNSLTTRLLNGTSIPEEDRDISLVSSPIGNVRYSDVVIRRAGDSYVISGVDPDYPWFVIDEPEDVDVGIYRKSESFVANADQHEFVVSFDLPQNTVDGERARTNVLKNGFLIDPRYVSVSGREVRIDELVIINEGDVIEIVVNVTSNPAGDVIHVDGVSVPFVGKGYGRPVRVPYEERFESLSELVTFLFAYGRQLISDGWNLGINSVKDAASSFISAAIRGDDEHVVSFFSGGVSLNISHGRPSGLENPIYRSVIRDPDGNRLTSDEVEFSRNDEGVFVSSESGIGSVNLVVMEDQHVVHHSAVVADDIILVSPEINRWQDVIFVDAYMLVDWNGRSDTPGFILTGGKLLPNFEKMANDVTRYNDPFRPVDNDIIADASRSNFGYQVPDYYEHDRDGSLPVFANITVDDRTRYLFHIPASKYKGTTKVLDAFGKGANIKFQILEETAWKVADFGDRRISEFSINLDPDWFRRKTNVLFFDDSNRDFKDGVVIPKYDVRNPDPVWDNPPDFGFDGVYEVNFPVTIRNVLDSGRYRLSVLLVDENEKVKANLFHFDPATHPRLNHPESLTNLDYINITDPAVYTDGPLGDNGGVGPWGPDQVGQYWWDRSRYRLMDYHDPGWSLDDRIRNWGNMLKVRAEIWRENDTVHVKTIDPVTGQDFQHGLKDGDTVFIRGADQGDYNGEFSVKVVSPTEFTYLIDTLPDTPATGGIEVLLGFVDVFEWVESDVPPYEWDESSVSGYVKDSGDPSFVTRFVYDDYGNRRRKYYFWVKRRKADNRRKNLTSYAVERNIENPVSQRIPWFSIVDSKTMIIHTPDIAVERGDRIVVRIDERVGESNEEWILFSGRDDRYRIPDVVLEKIRDSLAGVDEYGLRVPEPTLIGKERYGTSNFPLRTVFHNREKAIRIFVDAVNEVMRSRVFTFQDAIWNYFPSSYEGVWWNKEDTDHTPDGKVGNVSQLNDLIGEIFLDGDIVEVTSGLLFDPWDGSDTAAFVRVTGGSYEVIGGRNVTASVDINALLSDPALVKTVFDMFGNLLSVGDFNSVVMRLIEHMIRDNPFSDMWVMPTSYISVRAVTNTEEFPFLMQDMLSVAKGAIQKWKPYHVKVRKLEGVINQVDDFDTHIDDVPNIKITQRFSDHECGGSVQGGWDSTPWDFGGWDNLVPYHSENGESYVIAGIAVGDGSRRYVFRPDGSPLLYDGWEVVIERLGEVIDPDSIGLGVTVITNDTDVIVEMTSEIDSSFTITLIGRYLYRDGPDPVMPEGLPNLMQPAPTDLSSISGQNCGEDRINTEVGDHFSMVVTQHPSVDMEGFDSLPFDSTGYDTGFSPSDSITFFLISGRSGRNTNVVWRTSDEVIVDDVMAPILQNARIGAVLSSSGARLVEGYHYKIESNHVIILPPETLRVTWDGNPIDVSNMVGGISRVYRNGRRMSSSDFNVTLDPDGLPVSLDIPSAVNGDDISVTPVQPVTSGSRITICYTGFPLMGEFGPTVQSVPISYHIIDDWLYLDDVVINDVVQISYHISIPYQGPNGIVVNLPDTVDRVFEDLSAYDQPNGFEYGRPDGLRVYNSADGWIYKWDAISSRWVQLRYVDNGKYVLDLSVGTIYVKSGNTLVAQWESGQSFTRPPVVEYPPNGEGVAGATAFYASRPNASIVYPDAWVISNYPGVYRS